MPEKDQDKSRYGYDDWLLKQVENAKRDIKNRPNWMKIVDAMSARKIYSE